MGDLGAIWGGTPYRRLREAKWKQLLLPDCDTSANTRVFITESLFSLAVLKEPNSPRSGQGREARANQQLLRANNRQTGGTLRASHRIKG